MLIPQAQNTPGGKNMAMPNPGDKNVPIPPICILLP